jgi:hypothetical protein
MNRPIKFTDQQLRNVMRAGKRVPHRDRDQFLKRLAAALADKDVAGGALQRAIAVAQHACRGDD